MSVDPVLDMRSPHRHNPYSYAANNPVNLTDPTGMLTPFVYGYGMTGSYGGQSGRATFSTTTTYNFTIKGVTYTRETSMTVLPNGMSLWGTSTGAGVGARTGASASATGSGAVQGAVSSVSQSGAAAGAGQGGGFWRGVGDVLGKIWNLPNTVIGTAWGLAGVAVGAIASVAWGALHVASIGRLGGFRWFGGGISFGNNAIQFTNSPLHFSGVATTVGNAIIYGGGQATPANYGTHEAAHTIQGQWLGPAYLPAHILTRVAGVIASPFNSSTFGSAIAGDINNPLEVGPYSNPPRPWP